VGAELNALVAARELYGLTEEEIAIVKAAGGGQKITPL